MKDNVIVTEEGNEIYEHKILELADRYVAGLDDPDKITGQNKAAFNGLLKYIQRYYMRYHKPDLSDAEAYDRLFDVYSGLCYKYNKKPTVLGFGVMCDISRDTFNAWKNGFTRQYTYYTPDGKRIYDINEYVMNNRGEYIKKLSNSHSDIVKKWLAECEAALYDGATEQNSIGCIFALKAGFGYTETAPVQVPYTGQRRTPEEIAAERGIEVEKQPVEALPAPTFVVDVAEGNADPVDESK